MVAAAFALPQFFRAAVERARGEPLVKGSAAMAAFEEGGGGLGAFSASKTTRGTEHTPGG